MNEQEVLQIFNEVGAIITDSHMVYASGKHGAIYINKDAIYSNTVITSRLCRAVAEKFTDSNVEAVIAPAIGGVILSQWVAYHLTEINGYNVISVYAEKSQDGQAFIVRRGYDKLINNKNVLVVEDIINTGNSVKKVIEVVRAVGGNVVGVGALWNRENIMEYDIGCVPKLVALINMKLAAWSQDQCPMCEQNIPINTDFGGGYELFSAKS